MRWHGRRVTVYAYGVPTDMRKGFDGLSALVIERLQRDPPPHCEERRADGGARAAARTP